MAFQVEVILVFNVGAPLSPLITGLIIFRKWFHSLFIERVIFAKAINSKSKFTNFPIENRKIVPLPQPKSIRILPHIQPILSLGFSGSC